MKLSVIVPVYNEEATLSKVVQRIVECGIADLELIIVDDGSTDGTAEQLQYIRKEYPHAVKSAVHSDNLGKGAAVRTAQPLTEGDAVVIQDADLEYAPEELPAMLRLFTEKQADAVFGSRYSGSEIRVDTFWHYFGNKFLTTMSNIMANIHLTDMETCYKMIHGEIFRSLSLECRRFGIEPEITAKLARRECRIYEMPIRYEARTRKQGKKIGWKDGVAALWYILKYNLLR